MPVVADFVAELGAAFKGAGDDPGPHVLPALERDYANLPMVKDALRNSKNIYTLIVCSLPVSNQLFSRIPQVASV